MKRFREWRIVDPMYGSHIVVCIGEHDELLKFLRRLGDDDPSWVGPSTAGKTLCYDCGPNVIWFPSGFSPWEIESLGTLVHETSHLARNILTNRGLVYGNDSEEAFAYFQQWLFNASLTRMRAR